jgi:hypothetical protein
MNAVKSINLPQALVNVVVNPAPPTNFSSTSSPNQSSHNSNSCGGGCGGCRGGGCGCGGCGGGGCGGGGCGVGRGGFAGYGGGLFPPQPPPYYDNYRFYYLPYGPNYSNCPIRDRGYGSYCAPNPICIPPPQTNYCCPPPSVCPPQPTWCNYP